MAHLSVISHCVARLRSRRAALAFPSLSIPPPGRFAGAAAFVFVSGPPWLELVSLSTRFASFLTADKSFTSTCTYRSYTTTLSPSLALLFYVIPVLRSRLPSYFAFCPQSPSLNCQLSCFHALRGVLLTRRVGLMRYRSSEGFHANTRKHYTSNGRALALSVKAMAIALEAGGVSNGSPYLPRGVSDEEFFVHCFRSRVQTERASLKGQKKHQLLSSQGTDAIATEKDAK